MKLAGIFMMGASINNMRSGIPGMAKVTSWAERGVTPDLNPGRWVMKGNASTWNFAKTGLWGPKGELTKKFPYLKLTKSNVPFKNSVTGNVSNTSIQKPSGFGIDGTMKALLGQRKIK